MASIDDPMPPEEDRAARHTRPPADYVPYGERKPVGLPDSLDALVGPTVGLVTLPISIDWSGSPTYDLDSPGVLESMYRTVLEEAFNADDLHRFLNREKLMELWPTMRLRPKVRRLWEEKFPELVELRRRA